MAVERKDFGKDHWSLLAYFETRCVDHIGFIEFKRMRINLDRHPMSRDEDANGFLYDMIVWNPEHGTRLKGHLPSKPRILPEHDDYDCMEDLEKARLIDNVGTGLNPYIRLTKKGRNVCAKIRVHKQDGGSFATFEDKYRK